MERWRRGFTKNKNYNLLYKAFLGLEKGRTNKDSAQLFGVPANTLSTWKKIKIKAFKLSRKGGLQRKGRKLRSNKQRYDQVNKAVLKRFKMLRSENVHTNGVLIKELTFENFQTSDGWLDKWKKMLDLTFLFQIILLYNYRN